MMKRHLIYLIFLLSILTVGAFETLSFSYGGMTGPVILSGGKPSYMKGAFTVWDMAKQMQKIYSPPCVFTHASIKVASFKPKVYKFFKKVKTYLPKFVLKNQVTQFKPSVHARIMQLSDDNLGKSIHGIRTFAEDITMLIVDTHYYTYYFEGNVFADKAWKKTGDEMVEFKTNSKTASWVLDAENNYGYMERFSTGIENGDIKIITKSTPKAIKYTLGTIITDEFALWNKIIGIGKGKGNPKDIKILQDIVAKLQALFNKKECKDSQGVLNDLVAKLNDIKKKHCDEERKAWEQAKEDLKRAEEDAQRLRDMIVNMIDGATYDPASGYENVLGEKKTGLFRISAGRPLYLSGNAAVAEFNEKVEQFRDQLIAANNKVKNAKDAEEKAKKKYDDCMKKSLGDDDSIKVADKLVNDINNKIKKNMCDKKEEKDDGGTLADGGGGTTVATDKKPKENQTGTKVNETGVSIPIKPKDNVTLDNNTVSTANSSVTCGPTQPTGPAVTDNTEYYRTKNTSSGNQHDGTLLGNWSCAPTSAGSIARDITNRSTAPDGRNWTEWFRERMGTNVVTGSSVLNITGGLANFTKELNLSYNLTIIGQMFFRNGSLINTTMYKDGVTVHITGLYDVNWTWVNQSFHENDGVIIAIQWATGDKHALVLDDIRIRNINGTRKYYISFMDPWTGQHGESEMDEYGCFYIGNVEACITHLFGLKPRQRPGN